MMSRVTKTWATSAWMGKPLPDKITHRKLTTPPIDNFVSIFGGQAKRTAVTIPNGLAGPVSLPPSGGSAGTRPYPHKNPPKTGGEAPRATTERKNQVGGVPPR